MTCRNDFFYYYYFDNLVTAFFEKRGGVINFLPLKRGALNREFTVFYIPGGGVLPRILNRVVPRRLVNPNPI